MGLKTWQDKDDDILRNMYSDTTNKELSELMNKSIEAIRKRANRLGLYKNKDFIGKNKNLTHDEFINRIITRLDPTLICTTKYTAMNIRMDFKCINGHEFSILPSTTLRTSNQIVCKECAGRNAAYHFWEADENLRDKLIELINKGLTYVEIAQLLKTTNNSIQRLVKKYDLTYNTIPKFDKTWSTLHTLCSSLGYTIISKREELTTSHEKFDFICNNGHENTVHIKNFLNKGYRCSKCSGAHASQAEKEILEFIRSNYNGWIIENDRSILQGKELDIVIPDLGLAFEYNGNYWHSDAHVDKYYHYSKTNSVNDFEYQLFHIYEDMWKSKQGIVKSKILSLLGTTTRIFARHCNVKEIGFPKEFLDNNHLQGAGSPTKYNYGLYHGDELVAVMTFGIPRFSSSQQYELIRYCSKINTTVVGGASKLFKRFRDKSIISYSNRSWSNGNLYKRLGFAYSHTSEPNYKYIKGDKILTRYQCQKHLLKDKFPEIYKDELTEREIMHLAGYYVVYDSGNDVWVYSGNI